MVAKLASCITELLIFWIHICAEVHLLYTSKVMGEQDADNKTPYADLHVRF